LGDWYQATKQADLENEAVQANNVRLNGCATKWAGFARFMFTYDQVIEQKSSRCSFDNASYATQFANGCVPYEKHPGWSRCADGTIGYQEAARRGTVGKRRWAMVTQFLCGCTAGCNLLLSGLSKDSIKCQPLSCSDDVELLPRCVW